MTKIQKLIALVGLPVALAAVPASAAPLVSIGDTVDVYFRGSVSGQYRSNVFNSPQKEGDYLGILSPGVEVNIGRNSNANVKMVFREDFYLYNKFTNQNVALANFFLDGIYNTGPLATSAGFSFVQTQQNTAGTAGVIGTGNTQVRRDLYNAYIGADYDISPKTYGNIKFNWNRVDYTNNQDFGNSYSDRDVYSAPLNVYYRYSPKLGIGLGYSFRYTDVANNQNSTVATAQNPGDYIDNFVSLAIDGELMPKLTGKINLGATNRSFNSQGLSDDTTFTVLSSFNYEYSPKLDITAGLNRDFGTGAIGQSTINTGGYIGAKYAFSDFISSSARFNMVNSDYQGDPRGRSDDTIRASAAVTYTPNIYLQFTLAYNYINNSSNVASASFMGHTVDLSASLRY